MEKRFCAVDYETLYDSKSEYSLKNMTYHAYVNHPRFDAYLVSIYGNDADGNHVEFCGNPKDFDWLRLTGVTLVAHNASFDGMVTKRLMELKIISDLFPEPEWVCTADMCAFLKAPRNLAGASQYLLGKAMSKKARSDMDGKNFHDLDADAQKVMVEYAMHDSVSCFQLWEKYGDKWPEQERFISKTNRESGWRGVCIDKDAVDTGVHMLSLVIDKATQAMPWAASGEKPLSDKMFRQHARSQGIEDTPASLKRDDPVMVEWVARNKDKHPFVQARLDFASANPHLQRLLSLKTLLSDENVVRFDLFYYGCHTGRSAAGREDSGKGSKFNALNIPRQPVFGVDMRGIIIPRAGYKFAVYDQAQIEARVVQWIAGNDEFLDFVRTEGDIYQAYAKFVGWFKGVNLKKEDPALRQLAKICVLGLGYGMSWGKLVTTADRPMFGNLKLSEEKAKELVTTFREKNWKVKELWYRMHRDLETSAGRQDKTHVIKLPSWRDLTFYNPKCNVVYDAKFKKEVRELSCSVGMHLPPVKMFGGKLTENTVQATARDTLFAGAEAILKAHKDWFLIWNIYDELVFEIPEKQTEDAKREIPLLMKTAAPWAAGCPLDVEGVIADRYHK